MRIPSSLSLLAAGLVLLAAACGDDHNSKEAPSAAAPGATATPRATGASTQTAATATPGKAPTALADGTIDPLGGGQQTPWTVKGSTDPFSGVAVVSALRAGVHPEQGGWERIVFEFAGKDRPPAVVQYVGKADACGSGQAVAVQGTAILEVAITGAQAHDNAGKGTIPNTLASPGGKVINGGVSSCDFEGRVTWDFGMNGKHNFKVTTLTSPTRIVIDIEQ